MNLYVESSALLAWLLREPKGPAIETLIDDAENIVTSDLTLVECDRAFQREVALGRMTQATARGLSTDLANEASGWIILRLAPSIVARARQAFPGEPIRSLDALHVASALEAKAQFYDVALLSLDDRVRRVGYSLGFSLQPDNLAGAFNE
ncbi:MAG: type II toxin-antitoxin system VapC family toxin [Rhizomicrobium sp.]